jgi:hypothetical protein
MNESLNESACSWASFQKTHKHIVDGVMALSQRIKADAELTALINKKFAIKCTTGYSINALVGMCVRRASGGGEKGEACAENLEAHEVWRPPPCWQARSGLFKRWKDVCSGRRWRAGS